MTRGRTSLFIFALLLPVALLSSGCHKKPKSASDATVEPRFSEDELWDKAQGYLKGEKWKKAGQYMKLLLDQYPTGKHVKEAQILYADTLFDRGSDANLIEAQAKYLAYVSFYPEDEQAAYAAFRVAMCNYKRRGKPDRDQAVTHDAINELEKVTQSYPQSSYANDAKPLIKELRGELARHEYSVARFYSRRGYRQAVVKRLKFLLEKYPEYDVKDQVYLLLAQNLDKLGNHMEEKIYLELLIDEYAGSNLKHDAQKLLEDARKHVGEEGGQTPEKDKEKAKEPEMKLDAPPPERGQSTDHQHGNDGGQP